MSVLTGSNVIAFRGLIYDAVTENLLLSVVCNVIRCNFTPINVMHVNH